MNRRPLRFLYLCSDPGVPVLGRKGASAHVRALAAALVRLGHGVVVAAPTLTRSPWEQAARFDVPLLHLPPSPETLAVFDTVKRVTRAQAVETALPGEVRRILFTEELVTELVRRFRERPPDVVYERASLLSDAGVRVAEALSVPLVLEVNAPLSVEQSRYRAGAAVELAAAVERRTLAAADAVVVVSRALRDHAVALGTAPERVAVLPNGVDPELFSPAPAGGNGAVRRRLGVDGDQLVGFVGGLRPWHGIEALPELLARLAERHADVRLVIAGDGELRGELAAGFSERGVEDRAVFAGALQHEEVPQVLRELDVAVAPYPALDHDFYFSPLKLFEYMACGVPVVAARVGQVADVVRDGETGLLYPPGELDDLVAACERLLADGDLRRRLGQAAAAEVRSRYTWAENAKRVSAIAERLVEERP